MMWGPDYGAGGWAMMLGSIIVGVVLIALIVLGVAWLIRTQQDGVGDGMSGKAILDARYARGEIDEADYKHRRQLLAGGSASPAAKS